MERKLGEIFTCDGKTYQVLKGDTCDDCCIDHCYSIRESLGPCVDIARTDKTGIIFKELNNTEYRIKPEPKYRPFKDAKECWAEMQKHKPFGWTKLIGEIEYSLITDVDDTINYSDAIKEYTFADGTPFGIREEQL